MEIPKSFLRVISSQEVAFSIPEEDFERMGENMANKAMHHTTDIFGAPCIINTKWVEGIFMSTEHSREMFTLYEKMLEDEEEVTY